MFKKIYKTYGYNHLAGQTIPFQGQDSEKLFENSKKEMPSDWFYHTYPVDYTYNSIGHRSMEPHLFEKHNPTKENYILFTGCSFTEGTGVALNHTYSKLTAWHYNMHCYNLGLGGSGVDLVAHNLSLWLNHYSTPTAVVLQWPQAERKFYRPNPEEIHSIGSWVTDPEYTSNGHKNEAEVFKSLMQYDAFDHYYRVIRLTVTTMLKLADIPYVELFANGYINIGEISADESRHIAYPPLQDKARDLAHPGIKWNELASEHIIEKLTPQLKAKGII